MKSKSIPILSSLLIIFFVIMMIDNFWDGRDGWNSATHDFERGMDEASSKDRSSKTSRVLVNLEPIDKYSMPDTLTTSIKIPYQLQSMTVQVPTPKGIYLAFLFVVLFAFPILIIGGGWGIIAFIKLIRDVQRQKIFTKENVKRLYVISAVLIFIGILTNIFILTDYYSVKELNIASFQGYKIADFEYNYELFFVAVLFALFGKIFSLGVKMKEEQDLTV